MIINIIGDCDKRPVLYTVMKICQGVGDVLLVTSSSRLIRLSDTRENYGHCQNTMIAVTHDSIDEFWEECQYDISDFTFTIVDNIIVPDADVVIYVKGLIESEQEKDNLEYVEGYKVIDLYKGKLTDNTTLMRCEEFEAMADFCVISPKIAELCADALSEALRMSKKSLVTIATTATSTHPAKVPPVKKAKAPMSFGKKGGA